MKRLCIYIGILFLIWNCKKEIGPQNVESGLKGTGNVIILNEGNFGFGNASVSIYNPETKEIFNNQFQAVNGFGIGDVLQSVNRYQDKLYFVVNNSGKIVVTDTNLVYQSEITGFTSPRYIEFYNGKGFVTDLKQKGVYIVDLISNQITGQINTDGWTETILIYNDKLLVLDRGDYLSNSNSNYIYIINPLTLIKEDSISTAINPNSMVVDKNDDLWVLSSGKTGVEVPKLSKYRINSGVFVSSFSFAGIEFPSNLIINTLKNELYYINSSVYNMPISNTGIPLTPFYQKSTENLYGISFDKELKELFVLDVKDYNQKGEVIRLNSNKLEIDKFMVGIIPNSIY